MTKYNHKIIESKWQSYWAETDLYKTGEDKLRPKYYILDMFPYPSGVGLHVGHPKGYIATDIFARMKMMQGFNVLHPMGWDAFGLPAENYALKNKLHPRASTERNIETFKKQLYKLGFTYDWDREINTTDPEFYKWTQWIFIQMFKGGLAFESFEPIIWCPSCQTGLAMEDLEEGKCERCGSDVERKPMRQWVLKITDYADRLLYDLEKLPMWEESIKEMQKNWIGRSEGAQVTFGISDLGFGIEKKMCDLRFEVFTTRPDTLFGCTYVVLSPEHPLVGKMELGIGNWEEVKAYIENAKKKSDLERTELQKEKTGVKLEGVMAINPVNNEEIPVYVADYVMMGYGTGAIMAVPAHDERDWEFAKKYNIKIIEVVLGSDNIEEKAYSGQGRNINSDFLNGLETKQAKEKMINWLEEKGLGKRAVNYKIKDWVFSRQRYWGEPIPIIHCDKCGNVAVPEKDLPLRLPEVKHYEPTGTGESPLANITEWVNTTCPNCGGPAKRETNTMPQWAGSSWYYLRYIDPHNDKALVDKEKDKYWSPVDFYVGGAEHATRHLIYSRFWHKFLFDIGAVNYDEPFTRLQHVGLILAEDGRKMSKRWGNVINPDDVIEKFGADTMRMYEMFMGPFSQPCAWNTSSMTGIRRFLERVWKLSDKIRKEEINSSLISNFQFPISNKIQNSKSKINILLHKTIKKVGEDIEQFKFNTAISALMILLNEMEKEKEISIIHYSLFIILLAPFAPHISEELWSLLGKDESIFKQPWPQYDPEFVKEETITIAIQINGKVRDEVEVGVEISEDEIKKLVLGREKVVKWLDGKEEKKIIYVKGRLVSISL